MAGSSIQSTTKKYDVFVSFEGDTRLNFVDHLFGAFRRSNIVAFRDDTMIMKGESLEPELVLAIEGSLVYVVVFSKNYASSTRCLRELEIILRCVRDSRKPVFPVFYDVDPSEVRGQNGRNYYEAFAKHEERFKQELEVVQNWRDALKQVASRTGLYMRHKPQYQTIENLVNDILNVLVSSNITNKYDVFVSFRGEVRLNFMDHLFAAFKRKGIFAFSDDTMIKKGESLAPELIRAIEGSLVYVVVFSTNFASSTWCLQELEMILKCVRDSGKRVFPVFYDVDPSELQCKELGSYAKAFANHEDRFKHDLAMVQNWKDALTQAADLPSWDMRHKPQYAEMENLVKEILNILGHRYKSCCNWSAVTAGRSDSQIAE